MGGVGVELCGRLGRLERLLTSPLHPEGQAHSLRQAFEAVVAGGQQNESFVELDVPFDIVVSSFAGRTPKINLFDISLTTPMANLLENLDCVICIFKMDHSLSKQIKMPRIFPEKISWETLVSSIEADGRVDLVGGAKSTDKFNSCDFFSLANAPISVVDCFAKFTEQEQLKDSEAMLCRNCQKVLPPLKKFDIWSTPEILFVHLKRFQYIQIGNRIHRYFRSYYFPYL
jgi:hypothetical protein